MKTMRSLDETVQAASINGGPRDYPRSSDLSSAELLRNGVNALGSFRKILGERERKLRLHPRRG